MKNRIRYRSEKLNDYNLIKSSSRPISLDLHTYSHQENFLLRHHTKNFTKNETNSKCNKENHNVFLYKDLNHYSTPNYQQNEKPFYKKSSKFDCNNFSPSTKLKENTNFSLKPINLDTISTSSISEDESNDFQNKNFNTRNTFYSTSDMTTSDSEIYRYPNLSFTRNNCLTFGTNKSLSTIYPNNSSIFFEDFERGINEKNKNNQNKSKVEIEMTADQISLSSMSHSPSLEKPILEMIEEISPVLPPPDANDDMDLPPIIQPLKLSKEWKPIQTSTMTNFHRQPHPIRIPKTNPRHQLLNRLRQPQTETITITPNTLTKNQSHAIKKNGITLESPTPPPKSLFDPSYQDLSHTYSSVNNIRPEQFNLPTQLAKQLDVKGILFLSINIINWTMIVKIKNAAYFFEDCHPSLTCVKVEIKRNKDYRKRCKYDSRFKSYRSCVVPQTNRPDFYEEFKFRITSTHLKLGDKLVITIYVANSNKINRSHFTSNDVIGKMSFSLRRLFRKASQLSDAKSDSIKVCDGGYFLLPEKTGSETHLSQDNILHQKYYDEIGSSTFSTLSSLNSGSPFKLSKEFERRNPISVSKMPQKLAYPSETLPLSQLTKSQLSLLAKHSSKINLYGNNSPNKKNNNNNTNINFLNYIDTNVSKKYFNENSLNLFNLQQTFANQLNRISKSDTDTYKLNNNYINNNEFLHLNQIKKENNTATSLDYSLNFKLTSSSSGDSSSVDYKRRNRCNLPSVTTTNTDTTTSDYSNNESSRNKCLANYHFLHTLSKNCNNKINSLNKCNSQLLLKSSSQQVLLKRNRSFSQKRINFKHENQNEKKTTIRRVASFTFSPKSQSMKHNKKDGNSGTSTSASGFTLQRKFTLGSLGKTFNFLKGKVDTAISTSTLYPTKEDCRLWRESFEALLNNKYGCYLFKQFVEQEFSSENLEFWLACEEFKKMKEGKKSTLQKAQYIYNVFIKEGAAKEINIDSATKMGTKAAIESGIRSNTFDLAQNKIEQLMSKDSYQRFLKSDIYLSLLNQEFSNTKSIQEDKNINKNELFKYSIESNLELTTEKIKNYNDRQFVTSIEENKAL